VAAGSFYGSTYHAATSDGNVSVGGLRELQNEVYRQSLGGGHGQQTGATGPVSEAPPTTVIYGLIRDDEFSGSASGSGVSFSPSDASFTAPDGYTAYAFDEVNPFAPWRGEIMDGGIGTTLPVNGEGGGNFAYPLNGESLEAGVKVMLRRAGEHWVIVGSSEPASGSGDSEVCIDCGDGEVKCFKEGSDGVFRPVDSPSPVVPPTVPGETPKECYERCITEGGTPEACAEACGLPPEGDGTPSAPLGGGGDGGGGGAGGGGFGGAP
jgi:hypothetical protein